jgi:hypothetical protein
MIQLLPWMVGKFMQSRADVMTDVIHSEAELRWRRDLHQAAFNIEKVQTQQGRITSVAKLHWWKGLGYTMTGGILIFLKLMYRRWCHRGGGCGGAQLVLSLGRRWVGAHVKMPKLGGCSSAQLAHFLSMR